MTERPARKPEPLAFPNEATIKQMVRVLAAGSDIGAFAIYGSTFWIKTMDVTVFVRAGDGPKTSTTFVLGNMRDRAAVVAKIAKMVNFVRPVPPADERDWIERAALIAGSK